MYKSEYPEWGRREALLWAVHEWCQDRPAGDDVLWVDRVATLVGGGQYVDQMDEDPDKQASKKFQAEQINLFLTLVNEGLIDATIHKTGALSFMQATVRGLRAPGLTLIRELPDPNQSLVGALDDITAAIRNLDDVTEEEKDAAEKATEELKTFTRNLAPPAAVQLLAALARPLGS